MTSNARPQTASDLVRRFKLYPTCKDSGIESLGEVPAHWVAKKTTWLFKIGSGTTPSSEDPGYYDGDTPWITTSELRESVVMATEKNVTRRALRDYSSLKLHPAGSVAVAMYGATIGRLGILGVPATVNQACCVFSGAREIDAHFWFYWLQMRRPHLISLGYGGGQPNLSQDLLRSIRVPVPPLVEQRTIAAFLDRETARIDALVATKERLIELLQEQRTALIARAVTKGLDPNVPLKDSGVEWLGEIPEHWDACKMWRISSAISGGTPAKENPEYWDGEIPWVSPKDMKRRFIDYSEDAVSDKALSEAGLKLVPPPAVLIVVRGMILAHSFPVGVTRVPVTINQDMKALRLRRDIEPLFIAWAFEGVGDSLVNAVVEEAAHGTRAIRMDQWRSVTIPVPPQTEQRTIVTLLDRETKWIDSLVTKVGDAIERLQELRTALISAAVTGKIDVREEGA